MFWRNEGSGIQGCKLQSKESTATYELVSINDKVSAYSSSSYYLQQ